MRGDASRAFYGAPGCLVVALVAYHPRALTRTPAGARVGPPRLSGALFRRARHPFRSPFDYQGVPNALTAAIPVTRGEERRRSIINPRVRCIE